MPVNRDPFDAPRRRYPPAHGRAPGFDRKHPRRSGRAPGQEREHPRPHGRAPGCDRQQPHPHGSLPRDAPRGLPRETQRSAGGGAARRAAPYGRPAPMRGAMPRRPCLRGTRSLACWRGCSPASMPDARWSVYGAADGRGAGAEPGSHRADWRGATAAPRDPAHGRLVRRMPGCIATVPRGRCMGSRSTPLPLHP
jgi:hypothetical protein